MGWTARYRVLRHLGEGAAGGVYLVEDRVLAGPPLALKRVEAGGDAEFRDSLAREFAVLASLSLPGVARVYDLGFLPALGDLPEGPYFTREYVAGEALGEFAKTRSWSERIAPFADILRSVAMLHRAGVVHGDLKPANVIVDAAGTPHLIDFGLSSRAIDGHALRGSGTPLYMAPEVLAGGAPSVRADIYALGATLWELVTGRAPLSELGAGALAAKLRGVQPEPPADLAEELRRTLQIAQWAMASDVRERAPSADEVLARLESSERGAQPPDRSIRLLASPRTRAREGVLSGLVEFVAARAPRRSALVTGVSGMGKSSVLRELKWRLQLGRVRVLEVRCSGDGLEPFVQLFRQLLVFADPVPPSLSILLEDLEAGRVQRAQLAKSLSVALSARDDAVPLVVLVDDIDHAEPLFAEALRLAVHGEHGTPLTVVASAVDLSDKASSELSGAQNFPLSALAPEDMNELARQLLGPLDAAAMEALLSRTEGNPGILVEAAFELQQRDVVTVAEIQELRLGSIGERLARARVAALQEPERLLLTNLSLLRRALPESLVLACVPGWTELGLEALVQSGVVRRERTGLSVTDTTLTEWLRSALGRTETQRLASAMLARSEASTLDLVLRAELSVLAEAHAEARILAPEAAQVLRKQGANAAAARLLEASLSGSQGTEADELRLLLAELYAESGDANRCLAHADTLLARTELTSRLRTRTLLCAATALVGVGKLEQATGMLDALPADAPAAERAHAARVLSRVYLRRGEHDKARAAVARGLAASVADDPARPELLAIEATLLSLAGEREAAEAGYERALALAEQLSAKRDAAQVLGYRAFGYEREGNLERARAEYERSLQVAREAGDLGLTATYASNLGNVSFRIGHVLGAEQNFELAARLSRRAGRTVTALLASNNLAHVHVYSGSYARARQLAEAALAEASELGAETAAAQARHILGDVDARTKRPEAALTNYEASASLYRKIGRPRELAEVLLDVAEMLLDRAGVSDASIASARLASARDLIERHHIDDFRPRLRLLLALARAQNGDVEGALADLESLEVQVDAQSDRELAWQLLAAQAGLYRILGSDLLCAKKAREASELLEAMAARVSRDTRDAFRADPRRRRVFELAQAERRDTISRTGARAWSQTADPRLTRLLEILKRLARERDQARVLERITDAAVELSGAERGFVLLVDASGQLCPHTVREGRGVEQDPRVAFSRSIAEAVLIDGEPIITVNARDDARVNEFMSVHKLMLKSVACIPINGPRGVTGVLYLEHRMRAGRFQDHDVDLLLAFADQAAIALENAELWAENEARKTELEQKNRELLTAKNDIERLLEARTEELEQTRRDLSRARAELETRYARHGIVGQSPSMRRVFALIERVADSNIPVVVQGESGTGKELVARAIHFAGARKKGPFVAVNCAAIPDQLLESELFGHVRGAFTGADRDRKGMFAQAHGGTLFLDEFAEMSPRMQIDLLRVLQEGSIRPVGGDADLSVDVRIIVATNRPLEKLLHERVLREDLYYRLSVVELRLPALRDRVEDIPLLCQHFLARIAEQNRMRPLSISREALERITQSALPGNVRQLEHVLVSAAMMAEGASIEAEDLPFDAADAEEQAELDRTSPLPSELPPGERPGDLQTFKVREKERILAALDRNAWNRAKAATSLGIPRRTFYRRLSEFGIL
jgi:transcriptional regulator with GAF, ATPase, and Fis domain/tetratricopeptide (TPR) repeat protein